MKRYSGHFDYIVIGVGGMGSATVYQLAERGYKVLGLEQSNIPNTIGSSHGVTRIIRLAYFEHPNYVPLLRRSYELWRELQQKAGEQVLHITGSIDGGLANSQMFEGSRDSCKLHNLPHEILTSAELSKRFPGYQLPKDYAVVLQPEGGFLLPEKCITSHVFLAQDFGAEVHGCEKVLTWESKPNQVKVSTDHGDYTARGLVITAGPWASKLVEELQGLAVPERQVLIWMQPKKKELFQPSRFPVFNLTTDLGKFYGFPIFGIPGFKFARWHHLDEKVDPDLIDRKIYPQDENLLQEFATRFFPEGSGPALTMSTCMFTNTADEHFILDHHPDHKNVVVAAGFSGHGFKFCSVVGEIMADLAEKGETRHDVEMFQWKRLTQK
jgi:sarcosine oxidase